MIIGSNLCHPCKLLLFLCPFALRLLRHPFALFWPQPLFCKKAIVLAPLIRLKEDNHVAVVILENIAVQE
jgi:hypothetical protein